MKFPRIAIAVLLLSVLMLPFASSADAEQVRGYFRRNGTYVESYERTSADGNPYNNYSYPGNFNPNTGQITGGSQESYLNRYYDNSGSSSGWGSSWNTGWGTSNE